MINTNYTQSKSVVWASACTLFFLGFSITFTPSSYGTKNVQPSTLETTNVTKRTLNRENKASIQAHYTQLSSTQCNIDFFADMLMSGAYIVVLDLQSTDNNGNKNTIKQRNGLTISKDYTKTLIQKVNINPKANNQLTISIFNSPSSKNSKPIAEKKLTISNCN